MAASFFGLHSLSNFIYLAACAFGYEFNRATSHFCRVLQIKLHFGRRKMTDHHPEQRTLQPTVLAEQIFQAPNLIRAIHGRKTGTVSFQRIGDEVENPRVKEFQDRTEHLVLEGFDCVTVLRIDGNVWPNGLEVIVACRWHGRQQLFGLMY